MQSRLINDAAERTYAVIFEAFERATLGWFDWQTKDYEHIAVDEQVEVLSLIGDVSLEDGKPKLHAHCVLGKRGGATVGGHLVEAVVRPTLEGLLIESPGHLRRRHDPDSGLALIRFD